METTDKIYFETVIRCKYCHRCLNISQKEMQTHSCRYRDAEKLLVENKELIIIQNTGALQSITYYNAALNKAIYVILKVFISYDKPIIYFHFQKEQAVNIALNILERRRNQVSRAMIGPLWERVIDFYIANHKSLIDEDNDVFNYLKYNIETKLFNILSRNSLP